MGGREHLGVLDPHPDQLRDAEEAAVVQLGAGQPPPRRAVPLGVQELRHRQLLGARAQREHVVVVAQYVAVDLQVPDLGTEPVPEHRQQQPAALGLPVDVEPPRVRRLRALAQHLPQGAVVARGHRHVVRHDVDDEAETVLPRGAGQRAQALLAAQFGPHARVVHDVVAVRRARHRLQDRRQVQMGDAERGQVRHGLLRPREGELRLELEPVGGGGDDGGTGPGTTESANVGSGRSGVMGTYVPAPPPFLSPGRRTALARRRRGPHSGHPRAVTRTRTRAPPGREAHARVPMAGRS